jgi:hypothetical protein
VVGRQLRIADGDDELVCETLWPVAVTLKRSPGMANASESVFQIQVPGDTGVETVRCLHVCISGQRAMPALRPNRSWKTSTAASNRRSPNGARRVVFWDMRGVAVLILPYSYVVYASTMQSQEPLECCPQFVNFLSFLSRP